MLEVRPVLPSEHAAVGDLLATTYVAEGWATEDDYVADLRDVAGRLTDAHVLVAVDGGELLGTVTLAPHGSASAEQTDEGGAVVRMLVTSPAARGRGAGTALVQACLDLARDLGATHVRLSTQPGMKDAHRIYERLGFRRTPDKDWEPVPGLLLLTYALGLAYCSHCGEPGVRHDDPLEPPRWCGACKRRMVVQVHPTGWSARCVQHGTTAS